MNRHESPLNRKITRRRFLRNAAGTGLAFSAITDLNRSSRSALPRRPLGSTGLEVTILGLGCVAIGYGRHSVSEGAEIVHACIDQGINYIDCASSYGNAEVKVGEAMVTRRKEVVLTTKTLERSKESAWKEINRSLERLKTYVDLLQIHAINTFDDLELITGRDGSLAAAKRAKEEGMAMHIGITGHTRPEVLVEAFRRFPFATALVPLSSTDKLVSDFGTHIFPLSQEMGFGVIAMKVLAAGRVTNHVQESLRYSFTLPVSTAIVGMGTLEEVAQNTDIAREFSPMSPSEMSFLEEKTRTFATTDVMWWKRR